MKKKILILAVLLVLGLFTTTGCVIKEYKEPLIVEGGSNETLIVLSMVGNNKDAQQQLDSLSYLKDNKVATKRVELTQDWLKTGRLPNSGNYIPGQKAIKVDRTPVNLEWTADKNRGSSSSDQGIVGESKNSISFTVDWYVTATVLEENAHEFLYWYGVNNDTAKQKGGRTYSVKSRQLYDVVNTEVRRMVAKLFTEKTGKLSLDEIMSGKDKLSQEIEKEIKEHFEEKGITITASGWTGDITYFDNAVQQAINEEFKADRKAKAQAKVNQMNLDMAKNEVEVAKQERLAAEERQKAWDIIQQRRELDILENYVEVLNDKWNGKYPSTLLKNGEGSNQPFMMELPMPKE